MFIDFLNNKLDKYNDIRSTYEIAIIRFCTNHQI